MARAFRYRNYGIYILPERGLPHHWPHAHIKHRGTRIASVYLLTLILYDVVEAVPPDLLALIRERHQELLDLWEELISG